MIESYGFGKIVIDGKVYTNDLIILPGKIISNWWRREGHLLQAEDLGEVFEAKPEKLIIGTGSSGMMQVAKEVYELAEKEGINVVCKKTAEAVKEFNYAKDAKTALAVHLTC